MEQDVERIQQVVDYIEQHLALDQADQLSVARLAHELALSPWHFQRLFKSRVGDTLGNYIRGRRLTEAARLLRDTHYSIIDIAFQVGFNSHEAFSRSFKTTFALSPLQYRRQQPLLALKQKPRLSADLFRHLRQDMQRAPEIIQRPAQTLVGYTTRIPSPFLSEGSYCHLLEHSWMQLFNALNSLPHRLPGVMVGITISASGHFDERELDYMAAVVYPQPAKLPRLLPGMVSYELAPQTMAHFPVASIDTDTVGKTMDYIYGYWLPNSGYQRGSGDDYEWFADVRDMDFSRVSSAYAMPLADIAPGSG